MNWTNCPLYKECHDEKKDILTYCETCCSNPERHRRANQMSYKLSPAKLLEIHPWLDQLDQTQRKSCEGCMRSTSDTTLSHIADELEKDESVDDKLAQILWDFRNQCRINQSAFPWCQKLRRVLSNRIKGA